MLEFVKLHEAKHEGRGQTQRANERSRRLRPTSTSDRGSRRAPQPRSVACPRRLACRHTGGQPYAARVSSLVSAALALAATTIALALTTTTIALAPSSAVAATPTTDSSLAAAAAAARGPHLGGER